MKRFEIWLASLPVLNNSSVQHGTRPVVIISNNTANKYSPVVTVVPLTTKAKKPMRTHISLYTEDLTCTSFALCEQILTVDKSRMIKRLDCVDSICDQASICHAIQIQLGMAS